MELLASLYQDSEVNQNNDDEISKRKKDNVKSSFVKYWDQEKEKALAKIREEENLITGNLVPIIDSYFYSRIEPASQEIVNAIKEDKKPKILERKKVTHRIMTKIKEFIRTFEDDTGDL